MLQNCLHGFFFLLTGKTCPLYAAPKNGALACNKVGSDYVCAVMCKNGFDFSFDPPLVYFCSSGKWNFFSLPPIPFSQQLPWPDCSSKLILLHMLSVKLYGFVGWRNIVVTKVTFTVNVLKLLTLNCCIRTAKLPSVRSVFHIVPAKKDNKVFKSKEPMIPLWKWMLQFLWCTMIQKILDWSV